jgi:hypothetical protein
MAWLNSTINAATCEPHCSGKHGIREEFHIYVRTTDGKSACKWIAFPRDHHDVTRAFQTPGSAGKTVFPYREFGPLDFNGTLLTHHFEPG